MAEITMQSEQVNSASDSIEMLSGPQTANMLFEKQLDEDDDELMITRNEQEFSMVEDVKNMYRSKSVPRFSTSTKR